MRCMCIVCVYIANVSKPPSPLHFPSSPVHQSVTDGRTSRPTYRPRRSSRTSQERYLWVLGHYPLAAAKIAAGALLVGLAHELPELRTACERVRQRGQVCGQGKHR